jgi:hypothetical protein
MMIDPPTILDVPSCTFLSGRTVGAKEELDKCGSDGKELIGVWSAVTCHRFGRCGLAPRKFRQVRNVYSFTVQKRNMFDPKERNVVEKRSA